MFVDLWQGAIRQYKNQFCLRSACALPPRWLCLCCPVSVFNQPPLEKYLLLLWIGQFHRHYIPSSSPISHISTPLWLKARYYLGFAVLKPFQKQIIVAHCHPSSTVSQWTEGLIMQSVAFWRILMKTFWGDEWWGVYMMCDYPWITVDKSFME